MKVVAYRVLSLLCQALANALNRCLDPLEALHFRVQARLTTWHYRLREKARYWSLTPIQRAEADVERARQQEAYRIACAPMLRKTIQYLSKQNPFMQILEGKQFPNPEPKTNEEHKED